jgi:hypothetical protein
LAYLYLSSSTNAALLSIHATSIGVGVFHTSCRRRG